MDDFLKAWLVEGDVMAAMGYISERSYACLAEDRDDPSTFDRGMAPLLLLNRLKAAHDALGKRESLEGLTVGVHLTRPGLKLVRQPHHAQFVIYAVPDDVAAAFDCESRMKLGDPKKARREYGNYFGATFLINGPRKDTNLALLWAKEGGYWKIVSWQADADEEDTPAPDTSPQVQPARIKADASFVEAARGFLESWLIRKDYDAAFRYLSPKSYACYDLVRSPDQPAAASLEDAGQRIRAALERSGTRVRKARRLDELVSSAEPSTRRFASWNIGTRGVRALQPPQRLRRGGRLRRACPWRTLHRGDTPRVRKGLRDDHPLSDPGWRRAAAHDVAQGERRLASHRLQRRCPLRGESALFLLGQERLKGLLL